MGKAPAFQFYVKDWIMDPQLRMCAHSTKGIWMDILCYMWLAEPKGFINGTYDEIKRMTGATTCDFDFFITEAQRHKFCDISINKITDRNENITDDNYKITEEITLYNRRMYREYKKKDNNRLRQERFRNKYKNNTEYKAEITHPSPSPSPSPKNNTPDSALPHGVFPDKKSRHWADKVGQLLNDIKKSRDELVNEYKMNKVDLWIQQKVNANGHLGAISYCLGEALKILHNDMPIKSLYGYAEKIYQRENGNYNERDSIAMHEQIKNMSIENEEIKNICMGIGFNI